MSLYNALKSADNSTGVWIRHDDEKIEMGMKYGKGEIHERKKKYFNRPCHKQLMQECDDYANTLWLIEHYQHCKGKTARLQVIHL